MIDLNNAIMKIIPVKVKEIVEGRFTSLKNFVTTMCISDIGISQDKEHAQTVQGLLSNGLYLEWQDDMNCSIGVHVPDTATDKVKELVEFCFHTAKQYVFG